MLAQDKIDKGTRNKAVYYIYLAIIAGLLLFAYADNLTWLWSRWMENPNYSHGPLIPLISLFIVYQKRDALRNIQISSYGAGLYILIGAVLLYAVSLRAQVNFLLSYSMILVLVGTVMFLYGNKTFAALSFPILYLVFMVPFWGSAINKLGNSLKTVSSISSHAFLKMLGYPILREGVTLHLGNGSMEVADPCSGIRSLISLLALSTVIAYFSKGSIFKKGILVLAAVPLAVIGNTLRVVFFGIVLEKKGVLITEGPLHTLTGIGVFVIAFLGLIALSKWVKA